MRSVVVDSSAERRLVIADADEPVPAPSEALIRVSSFSLNLGETRRTQIAEDGWRPGWDLAGTVEAPASGGSGPAAGDPVVGFVPSGAWAELVAVPTDALAVLPDSVSFAQASTLPVAGLTAMYGLDRNGSILGRRVLITGANGGVGHLACQLARNAGAHVVGVVRRPERGADARDAVASAIVTDAGGPLSHAAVVAREYGIPAVVGTKAGTARIEDGTVVTVDGDMGIVRLES